MSLFKNSGTVGVTKKTTILLSFALWSLTSLLSDILFVGYTTHLSLQPFTFHALRLALVVPLCQFAVMAHFISIRLFYCHSWAYCACQDFQHPDSRAHYRLYTIGIRIFKVFDKNKHYTRIMSRIIFDLTSVPFFNRFFQTV